MVRFAMAGLLNSATDMVVYTLGVLSMRPATAGGLGALALAAAGAGMLQSYLLQGRWVFRRVGRPGRFLVVSGMGALVGAAVTAAVAATAPAAVVVAGGRGLAATWGSVVARLAGIAVTGAVDYVGYARWVFPEPEGRG